MLQSGRGSRHWGFLSGQQRRGTWRFEGTRERHVDGRHLKQLTATCRQDDLHGQAIMMLYILYEEKKRDLKIFLIFLQKAFKS